jgi:dipeptidyl aminopeptidase/acylaminoacyl peptidase
MRIFSIGFIWFIAFITNISAQTAVMTSPDIYSQWNKLRNVAMSDSAQTIIYTLEKEVGDKRLGIYHKPNGASYFMDRINTASVDYTGRYVVYTHGLAYDSTRTLKRKKTAKDKMPVDSLSIFDIQTKSITVIDQVTNFLLPSKYPDYLVYTRTVKKENPQDSTAKKSPCKDQTIIIRNLGSGRQDTIHQVKDYVLADEAPVLLYTVCGGDSLATYTTFKRELKDGLTKSISKPFFQITNLVLDKSGQQAAFHSLDAKSALTKKPYSLHLHRKGEATASVVMDLSSSTKPQGWSVSSDAKPRFSDKGSRLIFGVTPPAIERDTTRLDDEIVNVEIWHHDMPRLYTQLESTLDEDKKRSYAYVCDITSRTIHPLEDMVYNRSAIHNRNEGRYALLTSVAPYEKEMTWIGNSRKDVDLYDFYTRTRTNLLRGSDNNATLSPQGKYAYWFSPIDSAWYFYSTETKQKGVLASAKISTWTDELHDTPSQPDSYGIAGWSTDDKAAFIYDRYDIYKADPRDPLSTIALTNGRETNKTYRIIDLDPLRDDIDPTQPILMHVFDENTKGDAYAYLDLISGAIKPIMGGAYTLSKNVTKARSSEDLIYYRQSNATFPDIQLSTTTFDRSVRVSDANPQQANYAWCSNQLFSWRDYAGKSVEGMLFFPPGFDKTKKYPLIVNFYERSANSLHSHRAPEAHRSQINYAIYTNKGYVIFNPDISYKLAQPGDDCLNAVNSGVDALLKLGYIDSTRMGLQGHSWGGYQIAYMLTKTARYKCAEAGAAVVNMVSAYGGVRWESGMSRMFQYEKTQSRIGKTLWQDTKAFHYNSPIYQLDKVTTPVLIMHNDEDGAVPWEQGIEYYMAMRRLGKPAWLLNYNGEPHWPVKWQNRLDFNIRMEQFFDYYLMGKPMPLWMKEGNTPLEKGIINKY